MVKFDGCTEIYGIMGNPVSHSMSPAMHNRAFSQSGLNKVYVPFRVDDVEKAMDGFRALGVKGVSVTIPYKQAVIPFLDSIDPVAEKIGAVNTLVIKEGKIHGLNTDWLGANRAVNEVRKLPGSKVLLLGAGGSARAIGFGFLEAGASITIASRTPYRGKELAGELGCAWHPLEEVEQLEADVMVNATSVGMAPDFDQMVVPLEVLSQFQVVMDIVYSPLETKLLKSAAGKGCKVINGLAMLLYQGVAQFETWTGLTAPILEMRQELSSRL